MPLLRPAAAVTTLTVASLSLTACTMGDQASSAASHATGQHESAPASGAPSSAGKPTSTPSTSEPPTAKAAWDATQARIDTYSSLRVKADATDEGKHMKIDAYGTLDGKKQELHMSMGAPALTLRVVDGKNYFRANKSFYDSESGGGSALADKWLVAPDGAFAEEGSQDFGINDLTEELTDDSTTESQQLEGAGATVSKDTVNHRAAWKIVSADHSTTAWTSADGRHDILKYSGKDDGGQPVSMTFSEHNKPITIEAPKGAIPLPDDGHSKSTPEPSKTTT